MAHPSPNLVVGFDVNGQTLTITVGAVKKGNDYLICKGTGKKKNTTVAHIPHDEVQYIVAESVAVNRPGT